MRYEFGEHAIDTTITEDQIKDLAENMQQADKDSIWAWAKISPEEGLRHSITDGIESTVWTVNGKVAAMLGISQAAYLSDWACPWCLCSPEMYKHPRLFLKASKIWTDAAVKRYGKLRNVVDARHDGSIKWLEWLGFKVGPETVSGIEGAVFYKHEKVI